MGQTQGPDQNHVGPGSGTPGTDDLGAAAAPAQGEGMAYLQPVRIPLFVGSESASAPWKLERRMGDRVLTRAIVTPGNLPARKSVGCNGTESGKPGDGDQVPGGNEERGIVRAMGCVDCRGNAAGKKTGDRSRNSWTGWRTAA